MENTLWPTPPIFLRAVPPTVPQLSAVTTNRSQEDIQTPHFAPHTHSGVAGGKLIVNSITRHTYHIKLIKQTDDSPVIINV